MIHAGNHTLKIYRYSILYLYIPTYTEYPYISLYIPIYIYFFFLFNFFRSRLSQLCGVVAFSEPTAGATELEAKLGGRGQGVRRDDARCYSPARATAPRRLSCRAGEV